MKFWIQQIVFNHIFLMKRFYRLCAFFLPLFLCAQERVETKDSIFTPAFDQYIIDHKKQFNVKLEVGNDVSSFELIESNLKASLKPNLNLRYAVVLSYKFLSVRIGVRPNISEEQKDEKGDSDTFRMRFQLLFDNWNHWLEYNSDHGYYAVNTKDLPGAKGENYVQFPDLTSHVFFGTSSYKFNKKYSLRAIESQTEIQAKSAGSFMPGINYTYYSLTGTNRIKDTDGDQIYLNYYNEYSGINLSLGLAYYYTLVLKKYWFINAYAIPSAGIDLYKTKIHSPDDVIQRSFKDAFLTLSYGFGGGYNGKKIFFGADLKNRLTNEKFSSSKVRIIPSSDTFSVYFGYRFKAPKPISKPVDLIEKKVPILKDGNH